MADENNNMNNQNEQSGSYYGPQQAENTNQYYQPQQPQQPQQQQYYQAPQGDGQYNYNYNVPIQPQEEKANVGLAILSFLIPVVGLVLYITKKNDKPKTAKACGKAALACVILSVICGIISGVASVFIAKKAMEDPNASAYLDELEDFDYESYFDNASTDDKEEITKPDVDTSAMTNVAWDEYTVSINGKKIALPCSWETFKSETGFDFKDSENAAETLLSNQYTTSVAVVNGDQRLYVRFINSDSGEKALDQCMVGGINVDQYCDCYPVFAGGIMINDPADKNSLTAILGEPDDVYDGGESYQSYSYDDPNSYYNSFKITVNNGVISDIAIEHFEF